MTHLEVASLGIGYIVRNDALCIMSLSTVGHWDQNGTSTVVEFDRLQLPYQLLLSALVDTGESFNICGQ
jgi:hypothetical protein